MAARPPGSFVWVRPAGLAGRLLIAALLEHWGLLREPLRYLSGYLPGAVESVNWTLEPAATAAAATAVTSALPVLSQLAAVEVVTVDVRSETSRPSRSQ